MYTSIPDGSSNSEDEETDEMIDHTDKNFDEDDQSPPPKKTKSEEIKWKRQKFNSFDIPESHLNPIMYFGNLPRKTPLAIFDYFVDATLITKITSESNRYKHQKLIRTSDVSEIDIRKFIAVLIYMSVIRLPRHRMYWSKPTKQALISSVLTRHRFDEILSILHFNNNEEEPTKADNNYDKLFKIRPLINHFNTKFQSAAIPEEICSIDEEIIPHKGFSNLKRYNSSKPHKWGYKMYARAGKSSYSYQFEIEGDNQLITIDSNIGSAGNVVIRLTQNLPPNSFIAHDNYFATIRLIKFLNVKQYHVVSTMRTNRLNVSLLKPDKLLKREGRGSFDFLTTDDGHIVVTKWFDMKAVYILSNCFGPTPVGEAERFDRKSKTHITISRPHSINGYNQCMGGVDAFDMLMSLYRIQLKGNKWYRKFFYNFLDSSIINSWLIYKQITSSENDLLNFKLSLAQQLVISLADAQSESLGMNDFSRYDQIGHFPRWKDLNGTTKNFKSKRCHFSGCRRRTSTYCKKCKVWLCYAETNHFELYHQLQE